MIPGKITKMPNYVYYPIWRNTFECQLRVLYERLGKAVALEDEGFVTTSSTSDFEDFCLYIFASDRELELIDYTQN